MRYLTTFCSRPEATGDVISSKFVEPVVFDKCVKSHDPSLNHFPSKIPPEAVGGGIFDRFSVFRLFPHNFRHEVDPDVVSDVAVENVGMDVPVKSVIPGENGFRDIRGADFVSNERTGGSLSQ